MAQTRKRGGAAALAADPEAGAAQTEDDSKTREKVPYAREIALVLLTLGLIVGYVLHVMTPQPSLSSQSPPSQSSQPQQQPQPKQLQSEDPRTRYPRNHPSPRVEEELRLAYFTAEKQAGLPPRVFIYEDAHCHGGPYMILTAADIGSGMPLCQKPFVPEPGSGTATKNTLEEVLNDGGMLVEGPVEVDLYKRCDGGGEVETFDDGPSSYHATVMPIDGCTKLWAWPPTKYIKVRGTSFDEPSRSSVNAPRRAEQKKLFNVVFSAESAEYFYYQALVNQYAFDLTGNAGNGVWTRALTASEGFHP
mmetsp:Transcript_8587/g.24851  ORF Transcript_8587/g.24851 Transcript_8587/m.24851 type:complete len:305 (-) Transcript_8587:1300-2214(-)